MLKRIIKVSNVTNLSVARYCAGMFVDMMQINVDEASEHYLDINRFKEIRGWVAGLKIVIESDNEDLEAVKSLIDLYQADYFLTKNKEFLNCGLSDKLIFEGNLLDLEKYNFDDFQYYQFKDFDAEIFNKFPESNKSKLIFSNQNDLKKTIQLIDNEKIKAFDFSSNKEIRPGFQDFDELMEILEYLDE